MQNWKQGYERQTAKLQLLVAKLLLQIILHAKAPL